MAPLLTEHSKKAGVDAASPLDALDLKNMSPSLITKARQIIRSAHKFGYTPPDGEVGPEPFGISTRPLVVAGLPRHHLAASIAADDAAIDDLQATIKSCETELRGIWEKQSLFVDLSSSAHIDEAAQRTAAMSQLGHRRDGLASVLKLKKDHRERLLAAEAAQNSEDSPVAVWEPTG